MASEALSYRPLNIRNLRLKVAVTSKNTIAYFTTLVTIDIE